ncbi:winged helix-turn-helix domain-containing protein [Streptomyces kronopolitis]|uniref:winged helix-turn-helix domain-containing protein n=1 Tax=Streptomyces kronopolitis TaxID=1612435 RepID=UPI0034205D0D
MRRSRGRWGCMPRVCGVGGGCGSKAVLRACGDGRPPDAHPSWTTPRSRGSGPRWSRSPRLMVSRVWSRASVWRLLTGQLGWSLQRPERRAVERDESEVARWISHEWPRIKEGPRTHVPGSSSSTS